MKIKKLWIPTVIIGAVGGGAKICDTLFNYTGKGFFLDSATCNMFFVISLIAVFAIGIGMLIGDRKIEIYGKPVKSIPASLFGFIASVSIVGSGVISALSIGSTDHPLVSVISFVLAMLGGIVMLYESCICFTGQNGMKRLPYLTLALPAWVCCRLIVLFIEYSKVSINATEMFDVISVIFLALFMFYMAMFFAEINPKKCVGKTILYGCVFVFSALVTTADIILKMIVPAKQTDNVDMFIVVPTLSRILSCTMDIALCGFAIFFIISMIKSLDIKGDEEDDEDIIGEDEFFGHLNTGDKIVDVKEEIGEPVKFSGTTLTLEDTMSMDREEIKQAVAESEKEADVLSDEMETAVQITEESVAEEEQPETVEENEQSEIVEENEQSGTVEENEQQETVKEEQNSEPEYKSDKADGYSENKFEPAFEVHDDFIYESDDPSVGEDEQEDIPPEKESVPKTETENITKSEDENTYTEDESFVENVFADENGDVDYDEVFRMLDEMSENENF